MPVLRNRKPFRERYDRRVVDDRPADIAIRSNHYLYTERNAMYVMVDLSRRDVPAPTGSDAETLLCSVTYDRARKLLTISPDFTGCGEHYDVTNGYGIKYNYWLEHVSEERTPLELQRRLEDTRRVSTRPPRLASTAAFQAFASRKKSGFLHGKSALFFSPSLSISPLTLQRSSVYSIRGTVAFISSISISSAPN